MKCVIASAILAISTISAAAADRTITDLLENVCIASHLDGTLVKPNLAAMTAALGYEMSDLPSDGIRMLNPDAKFGWGVVGGDEQYLVFYSEKKMSIGLSRSCSVAVQDASVADQLRAFVRDRFDSKEFGDKAQGSFRVTAYRAILAGFEHPMLFSIQVSEPGAPSELTSISFFESAR